MLRAGADKIAINTAAIKNPRIIKDLAKIFGSQCIVISIEAKKISKDNWEVYTLNGREKTGINVKDWIKEITDNGAGEVLLTSIDKDGTKKGFDIELVNLAFLRNFEAILPYITGLIVKLCITAGLILIKHASPPSLFLL